MARGKPTSQEIRKTIVSLNSAGVSKQNIAQTVNLSRTTVRNVIKHFETYNSTEIQPKSGRPPVVSDRDIRALQRLAKENRRKTAKEISVLWNNITKKELSLTTTKRYLHKLEFNLYNKVRILGRQITI